MRCSLYKKSWWHDYYVSSKRKKQKGYLCSQWNWNSFSKSNYKQKHASSHTIQKAVDNNLSEEKTEHLTCDRSSYSQPTPLLHDPPPPLHDPPHPTHTWPTPTPPHPTPTHPWNNFGKKWDGFHGVLHYVSLLVDKNIFAFQLTRPLMFWHSCDVKLYKANCQRASYVTCLAVIFGKLNFFTTNRIYCPISQFGCFTAGQCQKRYICLMQSHWIFFVTNKQQDRFLGLVIRWRSTSICSPSYDFIMQILISDVWPFRLICLLLTRLF